MNSEARRRQNDTRNKRAQLERIYARDRGICQLCFEPVSKEDWSRDHIKDFALCTKEEARSDDNVQLAHYFCNNNKHNKPSAKPRTIMDSRGRPRLTQKLADWFPEIPEAFYRGSDE